MKKKVWYSMIMCMCIMVMTCTSCDLFKKNGAEPKSNLNVTELVKADKDQMSKQVMGEYKWFETQVVLKDYLDTEACDGSVVEVTNVFEYIIPDTTVADSVKSFDIRVRLFNHTLETDNMVEVSDLWLGDNPMEDVKLSFEDAYKAVMAANYPKPHTRKCTLRKEVGPKAANPQYIFGNRTAQLYVDAVDGTVRNTNPVYEGSKVQRPLGEWP